MKSESHLIPNEQEHQLAFTEISFLLDIFASTVGELMGGATASVGRIAGRQMARKLPIYQTEPTWDTVMQEVSKHLKRGYDISYGAEEEGNVDIHRCAIREVCRTRELEPGGDICKLFHFYLDGIVNELLHRPVRSTLNIFEKSCRCHMVIK